MKQLLLTNDDGIDSPGLHALANEFREAYDVIVMAPSRNCSGASQSITLDRPVAVRQHPQGYTVDGTPSDCVHLALNGALRLGASQLCSDSAEKYDGLVSGINRGSNLGEDVLYSGTVAAAREANLFGLSSIAVSLVTGSEDRQLHWASAAAYAKRVWTHFSTHSPQEPWFLNINVPNLPLTAIKGLMLTQLSTRPSSLGLVPARSPRGDASFWVGRFGTPIDDFSDGLLRDHMAVANGWVSVTPLTRLSTHPDASKHDDAIEEMNRQIYTGASV